MRTDFFTTVIPRIHHYRQQPGFGLVSDFIQANPIKLHTMLPEDIGCVENIEAILISMGSQHFDLLYDDWAWENKPKNLTEKKEIVKFRAKRSIDQMGDSNLKNIEAAFASGNQEEALAMLKAFDNNIVRKDK